MADYGKLASASVEWNDKELLLKLFENRVLQGFGETPPSWETVWSSVSVQSVNGVNTLEFLLTSSLMRPRYLIRLFENARRRAVTLGRAKIEVADYNSALEELGWQVLDDFDRELADVVPAAEALLFELVSLGHETSLAEIRHVIGKAVPDQNTIEKVIDVLMWTGCIGIRNSIRVFYISDCGFKRQFLRKLLTNDSEKLIIFHPTLSSIFGTTTFIEENVGDNGVQTALVSDSRQAGLL